MAEQVSVPHLSLFILGRLLAVVFVAEVRYRREPAGAAAAREDAPSAAEWLAAASER